MPRGEPLQSARGKDPTRSSIVYERSLPSHTVLKERQPSNLVRSQPPQITKEKQIDLGLLHTEEDSDVEEMERELAELEQGKHSAKDSPKTYHWMSDTPFNIIAPNKFTSGDSSIVDKYVH